MLCLILHMVLNKERVFYLSLEKSEQVKQHYAEPCCIDTEAIWKIISKRPLILNPSFSDQQLLQLILKDFGIQRNFENKFDLINALNEFLLEETGNGHNIVLIIDEAQNLGVEQLEQIRLLSNLETEKEKLLQIILIGQPELCEKLELSSLRQLNQRIAVRYHLLPLKRDEIKKYIRHRLKIASSKALKIMFGLPTKPWIPFMKLVKEHHEWSISYATEHYWQDLH